jgi:hypothetical protein
LDSVGKSLEAVVINIDADVRFEKKKIDTVKFDSVNLGTGCQIEHGIEINAGFSARTAFANEARPHGIVKLGAGVMILRAHLVVLSGIQTKLIKNVSR